MGVAGGEGGAVEEGVTDGGGGGAVEEGVTDGGGGGAVEEGVADAGAEMDETVLDEDIELEEIEVVVLVADTDIVAGVDEVPDIDEVPDMDEFPDTEVETPQPTVAPAAPKTGMQPVKSEV